MVYVALVRVWIALFLVSLGSEFSTLQVQASISSAAESEQTAVSVDSLLNKASKHLDNAASRHDSWWYFFILCFFAGLLTSFLPCVYPMIPITIGILQAQRSVSLAHNFMLALAYVLGICVTYASLGYLSASTSLLFGSWLASPWFMLMIVLFFVYLAGSMLGFYELYIPRVLQANPTLQARGSVLRTFVLGIISGTIASPCLAPPLAVLIAFVAQKGNPLFGFIAFFVFSLGLSFLLLLVGTFSGALALLPRAGSWLDEIKHFLGFILLGIALFFIKDFIGAWIFVFGGSIFLFATWYYLRIKESVTIWVQRLHNSIAILCFLLGMWFFVTVVFTRFLGMW